MKGGDDDGHKEKGAKTGLIDRDDSNEQSKGSGEWAANDKSRSKEETIMLLAIQEKFTIQDVFGRKPYYNFV